MKTLLAIVGLTLAASFGLARADGCYICQGGSYVKYRGEDNWDKRHKAEGCGCKVQGTTSSCSAANNKVLCSVG